MNGAEVLAKSLVRSGVTTCFANPGTSEMHFVAALDSTPELRTVLCLFEGVATGAADGYARMTGRPAATLLHLGPGLANGLANLHNARRASVPIVNVVGDHATYHSQYDAPLASDIAGFARPVSTWVHTCRSSRATGADAARAVQAARAAPGGVATLILPADTAWNEGQEVAEPLPVMEPSPVCEATLEAVATRLTSGGRTALLLRGQALQQAGLDAAGRIAAATGCRLVCDTFAPRLDRGAGLPAVERIPYFGEQMVEFLAHLDVLVLVGSAAPVTFFAYPGKPSWTLPAGCEISVLAHPHEDGPGALGRLADRTAKAAPAAVVSFKIPDAPTGKLNAQAIGQVIARHLPEGAIISDDGATSSGGTIAATAGCAPHSHLALTGGAIGQGMPLAVGAAIASPGRKVVCLSGDGSGMYTPQSLWTMAREDLDVTTVVFTNRSYLILNVEFSRVGAGAPGLAAKRLFDLTDPDLQWATLARSMGVEASHADTIEQFTRQFADAMARPGPRLIEVEL